MTVKKIAAEQVTFNISSPNQTLDDFDKIIENIRNKTGMKLKRSGLIRTLMVCLVESEDSLNIKKIYDETTLKKAVKKAIKDSQ
jgi:hypothetical protein